MKIKNMFKNIRYVFAGIGIFIFIFMVPIILCVSAFLSTESRREMEEDYYQYHKYDDIRKQYKDDKKNEN